MKNLNTLIQEIRSGNVKHLYFFNGPEVGDKNTVLKEMSKVLSVDSEVSTSIYHCNSELDVSDLQSAIQTNSLFGENKIIIIKQVENANKDFISLLKNILFPPVINKSRFENDLINKLKTDIKKKKAQSFYTLQDNIYTIGSLKKADYKALSTMFEEAGFCNIPTDSYVVLMNEGNEKVSDSLTSLFTDNEVIMFWELFEKQKESWVVNEFKKYNVYIENDAILFLLDTIENNKQQLETEIMKLAVTVNALGSNNNTQDRVIKKEHIEDFIYHSKEESGFTLFSAMLRGELERSIEILDKIYCKNEIGLVNSLVWNQRRFITLLDLVHNEKHSINQAFKMAYIFGKRIQEDFEYGIKNYSFSHSTSLFYRLVECEMEMRYVSSEELRYIRLQQFIIAYISQKTKQPFLQGRLQTLQY